MATEDHGGSGAHVGGKDLFHQQAPGLLGQGQDSLAVAEKDHAPLGAADGGLTRFGLVDGIRRPRRETALASAIAHNDWSAAASVYVKTGMVWEYLAPEAA